MFNKRRLERIEKLLRDRGLADHIEFLPFPHYIKEVVFLTNSGKSEEALRAVDRTRNVVSMIDNDLITEEREWLDSILQELELAISSSKLH